MVGALDLGFFIPVMQSCLSAQKLVNTFDDSEMKSRSSLSRWPCLAFNQNPQNRGRLNGRIRKLPLPLPTTCLAIFSGMLRVYVTQRKLVPGSCDLRQVRAGRIWPTIFGTVVFWAFEIKAGEICTFPKEMSTKNCCLRFTLPLSLLLYSAPHCTQQCFVKFSLNFQQIQRCPRHQHVQMPTKHGQSNWGTEFRTCTFLAQNVRRFYWLYLNFRWFAFDTVNNSLILWLSFFGL